MGDVANILAGEAAKHGGSGAASNPYPPPPPPPPKSARPPARPYGLTRDVLELLTDPNLRRGDVHAAPLPPMVPSLGFAAARYASAVSGRPVEGVALEAAAVDGDGDAIMEDDGAAAAAAAAKKASEDSEDADAAAAASAKQKAPPPTVPRTVKVGNRTITSNKPARRWVWAPFSSSARTDGAQFSHWVRSGVEYPDYPYARFDVHLDPMSYTEEEYERFMNLEEMPPSGLVVTKKANGAIVANAARPKTREPLTHRTWTKAETDKLVEFARIYELRWAVIHDRWVCHFGPDHRTVEELMHRYYSIGARLTRLRVQQAAAAEAQGAQAALRGIQQQQQQQQQQAAAAQMQQQVGPDGTVLPAAPPPPAQPIKSSDGRTTEELIADRTVAAAIAQADPRYQPTIISGGTGTTNKNTFDLDAERERRRQLDLLWYRSKEEEHEEEELRAELRLIEAQIRKLKKSGGHVQAAQGQAGGSRAATPLPSAEVAMDRATLDEAFASAAPVPKSGTPYMQSGRLENPEAGGSAGINKALLKRMEVVLKELHVPDEPLPTKRVCDMYDSVRKDTISLIALEKICLRREQEVQGRRARLSKLGGSLAALKAAERSKAKTKARQAASKAKSKKASSSSSGAGGGGKNASATSAAGGEKKKSTSGGSKSKSKKTKAEKTASGDGTAAAPAAAGAAAESPKKKPAKKSKKKKATDGDDAAKPKAKKQKKATGSAGSAS